MKAQQVLLDFQRVASWVCWPRSVDHFFHGNPETEVRGIAVVWAATRQALLEAAQHDLNLMICHEPPFYDLMDVQGLTAERIKQKVALLEQTGLTLLRCHDTWDRMPGVGIVDSWISALGLPSQKRPAESFYSVCLVPGWTVEETVRRIAAPLRAVGQDNCVCLRRHRQTGTLLGCRHRRHL